MHRVLSFSDITSVTGVELIDWEVGGLESTLMLHQLGFDIEKDIEYQTCLHTTISGSRVYGTRIIGEERVDDEWVIGDYCSRGNQLELIGKKDVSLLKEILTLGRLPNFTAMLVGHMKSGVPDTNIKFIGGSEEYGDSWSKSTD